MSEQKHTPERLKFARHSLVSAIIEDADGNRVAECMATTNDRQYRHNAERLADCWNACKGIPDPETTVPMLVEGYRVANELVRRGAGPEEWDEEWVQLYLDPIMGTIAALDTPEQKT